MLVFEVEILLLIEILEHLMAQNTEHIRNVILKYC
jgi:ABC-type iron transport system FetAB ATPase subunit